MGVMFQASTTICLDPCPGVPHPPCRSFGSRPCGQSNVRSTWQARRRELSQAWAASWGRDWDTTPEAQAWAHACVPKGTFVVKSGRGLGYFRFLFSPCLTSTSLYEAPPVSPSLNTCT